jgi:hypothetical protein
MNRMSADLECEIYNLKSFVKACSGIDINNAMTRPEAVLNKIKEKASEILEENSL